MYNPKLLESTFVEILLPHQKNLIVCCIYKHPKLPINVFTNDYANTLFDNIGKERNQQLF